MGGELSDEYTNFVLGNTPEEDTPPAERIVYSIVENLRDRRGIGDEWQQIDIGVQEEILATLIAIVKPLLPTQREATYDLTGLTPYDKVSFLLSVTLDQMRAGKPNTGTPDDRYWAISITEMEKVMAVFHTWVKKEGQA